MGYPGIFAGISRGRPRKKFVFNLRSPKECLNHWGEPNESSPEVKRGDKGGDEGGGGGKRGDTA